MSHRLGYLTLMQHFNVHCIARVIFLNYYTHLQLELFMVLVSGYMECVKLHHIWKPQPHIVVYHLNTTLYSAISLIYHGVVLLISTTIVVHIYCIYSICATGVLLFFGQKSSIKPFK